MNAKSILESARINVRAMPRTEMQQTSKNIQTSKRRIERGANIHEQPCKKVITKSHAKGRARRVWSGLCRNPGCYLIENPPGGQFRKKIREPTTLAQHASGARWGCPRSFYRCFLGIRVPIDAETKQHCAKPQPKAIKSVPKWIPSRQKGVKMVLKRHKYLVKINIRSTSPNNGVFGRGLDLVLGAFLGPKAPLDRTWVLGSAQGCRIFSCCALRLVS